MATNCTTVTCACGAKVIPRLWHVYGNLFSNTLTQHICPICGMVMYETGGGFRAYVPICSALAFLMFGLGYCAGGRWLMGLLSIGLAMVVVLFSFPEFSGRAVRQSLSSLRGKENPPKIAVGS